MKIQELQSHLKKKKIDAALILSEDPSYFYFLQDKPCGALIIFARKEPLLLINKIEHTKSNIKKVVYNDFIKDLEKIINKNKIRSIGVDYSFISVRQHNKIKKLAKTHDIKKEVSELRETKTKEEIIKIKKAIALTEKVLNMIVKNFKFKTEGEVKEFIRIEAIKNNCELAFEPIIASGKNAAIPHYKGDQKLKKGFLVMDFGLKYKGYCADITRTFYIGKPTRKEEEFYYKLLWIQEEAIKSLKPGKKASEIDKKVRDFLRKDEKYFLHGLGHGLGTEVHESPSLSSKSDDILKENMVVTIEPGYYHNFGIRIEDDVLITKKGAMILTKFSKELKSSKR